jgi:hypothetical protein
VSNLESDWFTTVAFYRSKSTIYLMRRRVVKGQVLISPACSRSPSRVGQVEKASTKAVDIISGRLNFFIWFGSCFQFELNIYDARYFGFAQIGCQTSCI